ncbi:hypothetical protein M427DRAFT_47972 [Gonapodya prolifera JEL478]|uniref:Protein kinase domain-containing protein n=1 Tax=Gonapodya prolifera (strain JEL478) TaxID=1344416 RepID=A0A139A1H2_GONPJ|nr:hypothetical protein M427DRAFT_47972 [Gonapodya prolifera JEL478]|eukprot:KXS10640.1 hypothetical protein M427DRAFT_47972 [Gonapodya prolifera JEL478]
MNNPRGFQEWTASRRWTASPKPLLRQSTNARSDHSPSQAVANKCVEPKVIFRMKLLTNIRDPHLIGGKSGLLTSQLRDQQREQQDEGWKYLALIWELQLTIGNLKDRLNADGDDRNKDISERTDVHNLVEETADLCKCTPTEESKAETTTCCSLTLPSTLPHPRRPHHPHFMPWTSTRYPHRRGACAGVPGLETRRSSRRQAGKLCCRILGGLHVVDKAVHISSVELEIARELAKTRSPLRKDNLVEFLYIAQCHEPGCVALVMKFYTVGTSTRPSTQWLMASGGTRNVVHRDLKPGQVLYSDPATRPGGIVLADFGHAAQAGDPVLLGTG